MRKGKNRPASLSGSLVTAFLTSPLPSSRGQPHQRVTEAVKSLAAVHRGVRLPHLNNCWSTCCCASRHTCRVGDTVSRGSSRWFAHAYGNGSICWRCSNRMGQHQDACRSMEPCKTRGYRACGRRMREVTGQQRPTTSRKNARPAKSRNRHQSKTQGGS